MVHHGTSWYYFYCFLWIWWLSQDRMQVPGEMCTCYCMLSWPTWQASRCLPLLQWLQKKESSKNPRSEVQTPACLSWCIFAHILTSFILLPCTMRTSCAIKGHWSLLANAATGWIHPTCTVVFQTFGQTNAITPCKTKIAPKKLAWKPFGMESKMVRLEGFGGVASVCMIQTRSVLLKLLENTLVKQHFSMIQPEIWSMATFRSIGPSKCVLEKPLEFLPVSTICGVPLRASHQGIWWHLMAPFHTTTKVQTKRRGYTCCELETLKNILWPKMMPYLTIHHISRKKM